MRRNNRNNNLSNFIYYFSIIIFVTVFLISYLEIRNQFKKYQNAISDLKKTSLTKKSIIKELQSKKEYYLSEKHISKVTKSKMSVATPEPIIIKVENGMALNE